MKTVIVLPVRPNQGLSLFERISFFSINAHLSSYQRVLVFPESSPPTASFPHWELKSFPDKFFGNANNYSRLLLNESFYETFSYAEWILVVHLDVIILNSLEPWLMMPYDYVGAPQFGRSTDGTICTVRGANGGLSLRRVNKFKHVLDTVVPLNLSRKSDGSNRDIRLRLFCALAHFAGLRMKLVAPLLPELLIHEDTFWARGAEVVCSGFRTAPPNVAAKFAWETFPQECWKITNGQLPFGVHAWQKYDPAFLVSILPTEISSEMQAWGEEFAGEAVFQDRGANCEAGFSEKKSRQLGL